MLRETPDVMNSILRNKLDSRNARLALAVDPSQIMEEAEQKVRARELEVTSMQIPLDGRVRPCKLVELGYSPALQRKGTVPKPPTLEALRDIMSPPQDSIVGGGPPDGRSGHHPSSRGDDHVPSPLTPPSVGGVQRTLFASADEYRETPKTPRVASAGRPPLSPRSSEKDLEVANAKYKEAKLLLMDGNIAAALSSLEQASAACPEDYEAAIQKISELYSRAQGLLGGTSDEGGEAADEAYKKAKAALRAGETESALRLLDWAFENCPERFAEAREKIAQLRALAASSSTWGR